MKVFAIVAGKGGVGKSTVTALLARAFTRQGMRVGVIDADIYGPSIPLILPTEKAPYWEGETLYPAEGEGIKIVSMAYAQRGTFVRAPLANGIIKQFCTQVEWGEIDFLLIDFPPGTGDIPLSVVQTIHLTGAVLITTPQELSVADARYAGIMLQRMQVPLVGLIENMAYFELNGERSYPFGQGGGERLAEELKIEFLSSIPLDTQMGGSKIFDELAEKMGKVEGREGIEGLFQKDPEHLSIGWSDGTITEHKLSELQKKCPCAMCFQGQPQVEEGVTAREFKRMGSYAVQIAFASGCSRGIYPYELLKGFG